MRIGEVKGTAAGARRSGRGSAPAGEPSLRAEAPGAGATASRALVAAPVASEGVASPRVRHAAPFIAQLVAGKIGMAQTRPRRRAAPHEAEASYGAAQRLGLSPAGRTRRWL